MLAELAQGWTSRCWHGPLRNGLCDSTMARLLAAAWKFWIREQDLVADVLIAGGGCRSLRREGQLFG